MEKARKILYMISGVLKIVAGGACALIGFLVFIARSVINKVFSGADDLLLEMSKELVAEDAKYQYLIDGGKEVQMEFVMKVCNIFGICVILFAMICILLGILNIIMSRKAGYLTKEKAKGIFLMIFCWIFNFFALSTILSTIAAFLHSKKRI